MSIRPKEQGVLWELNAVWYGQNGGKLTVEMQAEVRSWRPSFIGPIKQFIFYPKVKDGHSRILNGQIT